MERQIRFSKTPRHTEGPYTASYSMDTGSPLTGGEKAAGSLAEHNSIQCRDSE